MENVILRAVNIKLFTCNKTCSGSILKDFFCGGKGVGGGGESTFENLLEIKWGSSLYTRNFFELFAAISKILIKQQTLPYEAGSK